MGASKVYYTDLRVKNGDNLLTKLQRLIKTAGIGAIDFGGKYVAIKMHFGEPGNLAFLRPNYAKAVADVVKELGGKPFLTDCNTLYVGGRKNALDHLDSANLNGFNSITTGCQILIADGLKGTDEELVPVAGGEYVKEAKIGRAIMDADIFISLSHFKGHEATGFGGTLKNIGMGCGSRAGKMEMHSAGKPHVDQDLCIGCKQCAKICAHGAPQFEVVFLPAVQILSFTATGTPANGPVYLPDRIPASTSFTLSYIFFSSVSRKACTVPSAFFICSSDIFTASFTPASPRLIARARSRALKSFKSICFPPTVQSLEPDTVLLCIRVHLQALHPCHRCLSPHLHEIHFLRKKYEQAVQSPPYPVHLIYLHNPAFPAFFPLLFPAPLL